MNKEDLAFVAVIVILAIQFGLFMWSYATVMDEKAHTLINRTYSIKDR